MSSVSSSNSKVLLKLFPVFLFLLGFIIYKDCFLKEFFVGDELARFGRDYGLLHEIESHAMRFGRPLAGLFRGLIYNFVGFDTVRIALVRFFNFFALMILSLSLFYHIKSVSDRVWPACVISLAFAVQTNVQGLVAYGMQILMLTPALWFSFLSYFIYAGISGEKKFSLLRLLLSGFLLLLAFATHQGMAFGGLIPLSAALLFGSAEKNRKAFIYLLLLGTCFFISALIFSLIAHYVSAKGYEVYHLGGKLINAVKAKPYTVLLNALNPLHYHSAFELWNYPAFLKVPAIAYDTKRKIEYVVMLAAGLIVLAAMTKELRGSSSVKATWSKYVLLVFLFAASAVPLVMASPLNLNRHKPSISIPLSSVILITLIYALCVLLQKRTGWTRRILAGLAGIFLLWQVLGAQAAIRTSFVGVKERELNFIRERLTSRDGDAYDRIVTVYPADNFCPLEPCGFWRGLVFQPVNARFNGKNQRRGIYAYILAKEGIALSTKELIYLNKSPEDLREKDLLLDWNEYVRRERDYFANT